MASPGRTHEPPRRDLTDGDGFLSVVINCKSCRPDRRFRGSSNSSNASPSKPCNSSFDARAVSLVRRSLTGQEQLPLWKEQPRRSAMSRRGGASGASPEQPAPAADRKRSRSIAPSASALGRKKKRDETGAGAAGAEEEELYKARTHRLLRFLMPRYRMLARSKAAEAAALPPSPSVTSAAQTILIYLRKLRAPVWMKPGRLQTRGEVVPGDHQREKPRNVLHR